MPDKLHTLAEYRALKPAAQGYVQYMEGDWPGSELKNEVNPYAPGSGDRADWDRGAAIACQAAQDSEE